MKRCISFCFSVVFACLSVLPVMADNEFAAVEALLRLENGAELVENDEAVRQTVDRYLQQCRGTQAFLDVVSKLQMADQTDGLRDFLKPGVDASQQVVAVSLLIQGGQVGAVESALQDDDANLAAAVTRSLGLVGSLGAAGGGESMRLLKPLVTSDAPAAVKNAATAAIGRSAEGQAFLLALARKGQLPKECRFAAYDALMSSASKEMQEAAAAELKPEASTSGEPLPAIAKLIRMRGDGKAGKKIFFGKGTCGKCHQVNQEGVEVGPNLSEIGSKLSREAMYTAILNPNAGISHNYEQYALLSEDGLVLTGLLVNQNEESVTIKTAEGVLRKVPTDEIETLQQRDTSLMPENLHQLMSIQELLDLVDYLVLLRKQEESGFHVLAAKAGAEVVSRDAGSATEGLTVADGLAVKLFSAEPDLQNPSNIDVDHLGRVWVCEVVNYRHFRNPYNQPRAEGDRILVLQDTDGDGQADSTKVFYQGEDVNSAHGICVLDDRVIVSAGDSIFALLDDDGDLKADRKEVLFTGIGGVDHDHGIHAMVPGPDGKLYFNFGNEGHQLYDATGKIVVDQSGREVRDHGQPYQQGMVFRCDVNGKNVETLGWNFRNNWEVCIDSFGTMWQSDNDDDGNRATRINYVMQYGNYGYRGELDGSAWSVPRTGMKEDVSLRHWHLNDPGVVPNVVQTGAGSPTGITVYEGDLLPQTYRGQVIHCDPGPNSVRVYEIAKDGAGYTGQQRELLTGASDKWFRPVDVCVAPDGSLIVADWYDPGVGGHRMGDTERGRIFRVTPVGAESKYAIALPDFTTVQGAIAALTSPNLTTRYIAAKRLRELGGQCEEELVAMINQSDSAAHRARALWVLADWNATSAIGLAIRDRDADVRCVAIRMAVQHNTDREIVQLANRFASDPTPQVRREAALSLHRQTSRDAAVVWGKLAAWHDGKDRWYLEALGIGAEGHWDACIGEWLRSIGDDSNTPARRDIIWRSRSAVTCKLLADVITQSDEDDSAKLRYFRAFDFQKATAGKSAALTTIVHATSQTQP